MNHYSKLLTHIPPILLPKEITSTRLIEDGLNNKNILINNTWLVKEYLITDEMSDPVYLRFLREKDSLLLLKRNSHAPRLLKYYDDGVKFFIARMWVEGQSLTNDHLLNNVELLVNALMSIHSITEPTDGDFHYYDVIKRYLLEYKGIEQHYPISSSLETEFSHFPSYERVNQFFIDHIHQLQSLNSVRPLVRIHGDLVFSNIIYSRKNDVIAFIDWEYSTLADPCIDLAYLITQNQLPHKLKHKIVEKYEEQLGNQVNPKVLEFTCNLMNLMSGLWYVIQAARFKSTSVLNIEQHASFIEFLSFAQDRFQALDLIEVV
ncbi:MAG: phosphotransferase [Candidatus Hodarchaeota archaeon]